jgi:Fe-S cluster assembly protein SufD
MNKYFYNLTRKNIIFDELHLISPICYMKKQKEKGKRLDAYHALRLQPESRQLFQSTQNTTPIMSCCCYPASLLPPHHRLRLSPPLSAFKTLTLGPRRPLRSHSQSLSLPASLSPPPSLSDPFVLEIAEKLEDSLPLSPSPIQSLRNASSHSLLSSAWPNRKSEPYRFTDISYLRKYPIVPTQSHTIPSPFPLNSSLPIQITLINGLFDPSLSRIPPLPPGAFIGSIKDVPPQGPISEKISCAIASSSEFLEKDIFWDFNNVGAADMVVIYAPAGVKLADTVHLMFSYSGSGKEGEMGMSNPRVLVVVEEGADVSIVEEHFSFDGASCYWANPVMEILIGEMGKVSHSYVQRQPMDAAHIKWTFVQQVTIFAPILAFFGPFRS